MAGTLPGLHAGFLAPGKLEVRSCPSRKAGIARSAPQKTKSREEKGYFPNLEDGTNDTDLLPKREPGNFPDTHPRGQVQAALSAIERLSVAPAEPFSDPNDKKYDPLRDGPLRYLGYANEVGEAFAAWLPFYGVPLSYAIAIGYVLTDTGDKGIKTYKTAKRELGSSTDIPKEVDVPRLVKLLAFERSMDTVIWQLLASVATPDMHLGHNRFSVEMLYPWYTIHTIVAFVHGVIKPLQENGQVQDAASRAAATLHVQPADVLTIFDKSYPTLVGLAAIPFIVHPIDNGIHMLMNMSLRPQMRKLVCGTGQGSLANLQMCGEECIPSDAANSSEGGS